MSELTCDLLVIGSGAGGFATAVTAAYLGLDVVLAEKESQLGGTTAWSGGWMWVPRNPLAIAAGIVEDEDAPRAYLRGILGERYDAARVDRFLAQGPRMVSFMRDHTAMDFVDGNGIPDFHAEYPGGAKGGRSVCAAPFDGRKLGARITDLRPPLRETAPFGMGIASGDDLRSFMTMTRSLSSFVHVTKRVLRHFRDLALHRRGMHLVNGNALIARLLKTADDLGVTILTAAPLQRLTGAPGHITGAVLKRDGREFTVTARRGVVMATGGFPHDKARIAALFPHLPHGREHVSAAPRSNTGDGLRAAEAMGAVLDMNVAAHAAWAPVSLVRRPSGDIGHFPHLLERAKPGIISVRRNGCRFANEADCYYDMFEALHAATQEGEEAAAWLVCDHRFLRRFGLGAVRPAPVPYGWALRQGLLKTGRSIAELAQNAGIDPVGLTATIEAFNRGARQGRDPEFHRGESAYNRINGDREQSPNPCVAPIEHGPFYAMRIHQGSLGTFTGLATDEDARVLDAAHQPIQGLYAVGNDMASVMAGTYPSGGITIGPAMTFGYIIAHHAAGVPLDNNR